MRLPAFIGDPLRRFSVPIALVFLLAGCGGDDSSARADSQAEASVTWRDGVVLLSEDVVVSVDASQVILRPPAPALEVGAFIVGRANGGFARRVESVAVTGEQIVVQTSGVEAAEVLSGARVHVDQALDETNITSFEPRTAGVTMITREASQARASRRTGDPIQLALDHVVVPTTEGGVVLTGVLVVELAVERDTVIMDGGVEVDDVTFNGKIEASGLQIEVSGSRDIDTDIELGRLNGRLANGYSQPLPIAPQHHFFVSLKAHLTGTATGALVLVARLDTSFTGGYQKRGDNITAVGGTRQANPELLSYSGAGELDATFSIAAEAGIVLDLSVVRATASARAEGDLLVDAVVTPTQRFAEVGFQSRLVVGVEAESLSFFGPVTLFSASRELPLQRVPSRTVFFAP